MVNIDGIKVGLTICYDIRFPEIYRAYRKAGADLFINCAAWGLSKPIPWECMTRSRAVENQTFMVALTQSGYIENDEWNIGHSRIIGYKGETISEIKDQKEGAMSATLDFTPMYEFRDKCTCMNDIRTNYEVVYEENIFD
jgi:nitrilase